VLTELARRSAPLHNVQSTLPYSLCGRAPTKAAGFAHRVVAAATPLAAARGTCTTVPADLVALAVKLALAKTPSSTTRPTQSHLDELRGDSRSDRWRAIAHGIFRRARVGQSRERARHRVSHPSREQT